MSFEMLSDSEKEPPGSRSKHIPTSQRSAAFYKKFFPNSNEKQWRNWKWQIRNRITSKKKLSEIFSLTKDENAILSLHGENLPLSITPYYASLIDTDNPYDPIRKCVVPSIQETYHSVEETEDPLGEDHQSPVKCIVHRYPDRVLFLVTKFCSNNCRFCTRSRIVGEHVEFSSTKMEWDNAFEYIRNHPEVRDVLISGGDPLTMSNEKIEYLLSNLRKIPHVEMIRIGTKVPAVLPQRITPKLMRVIKKYHPIFMSVHFTHPVELTEESTYACNMLANSGVPLGSQTVLLKGVNNNTEIMRKLFTGLLKVRVKPYYTYIADKVTGSGHFRTTVEEGIDIFKCLQGKISGYAIPKLIIDLPNGMGKVPVMYNYIQGVNNNKITIENYENKVVEYFNG